MNIPYTCAAIVAFCLLAAAVQTLLTANFGLVFFVVSFLVDMALVVAFGGVLFLVFKATGL